MTQRTAPAGTIATIGHPANRVLIVKQNGGSWIVVDTGRVLSDEDFRAGWDLV